MTREDIDRIASEYFDDKESEHEMDEVFDLAKKALEKQMQEPKAGHWIEKDGFDGDTYYDCSECGESFCLIDGTPTDNLYNFCPNCGSKMSENPTGSESEDKEC